MTLVPTSARFLPLAGQPVKGSRLPTLMRQWASGFRPAAAATAGAQSQNVLLGLRPSGLLRALWCVVQIENASAGCPLSSRGDERRGCRQ